MRNALLSTSLSEADFTTVRSLTRQVAELVGLDSLRQTRLATAVSEISRNAVDYAQGGVVNFVIESAPGRPYARCLTVEVSDAGPGISDLRSAQLGLAAPNGKLPLGIVSSKRLVDHLTIEQPADGGTLVRLSMNLPDNAGPVTANDAQRLARAIQPLKPLPASKELEHQNVELLRVHQELKDKQLALEMADARKNQFVTTLAHELRNPLSTLELSLTLLRRKQDIGHDELVKRLDVMARQTAQLSRLVNELMDVACVSEGKVDLHRQPAELGQLTADAAEMASGAVAAKSHALTLQLHDEPLWVHADPARYIQILTNLIQNAARYTPERGEIKVRVGMEGGCGLVSVEDNGIGISAELLPHVFDLFVQGDAKVPGSEGGLGIGLTLVQHLVKQHGGTVSVASPGAGMGATFILSLPLIPEPV